MVIQPKTDLQNGVTTCNNQNGIITNQHDLSIFPQTIQNRWFNMGNRPAKTWSVDVSRVFTTKHVANMIIMSDGWLSLYDNVNIVDLRGLVIIIYNTIFKWVIPHAWIIIRCAITDAPSNQIISNIAMQNHQFIDDFPIDTAIYTGCSIATVDSQSKPLM